MREDSSKGGYYKATSQMKGVVWYAMVERSDILDLGGLRKR
jgi:hypothetical protein